MIIEIKAPSPGESISEVEVAAWLVADGDIVSRDQEIAEIESEKATLPLIASDSGQIKILKQTGEAIPVGEVLCTIDTSKAGETSQSQQKSDDDSKPDSTPDEPAETEEKTGKDTVKEEAASGALTQQEKGEDVNKEETPPEKNAPASTENIKNVKVTPVAKKMMEDHNLSLEDVMKGLRKINSTDIKRIIEPEFSGSEPKTSREVTRNESHARMSLLRRKLSERLVAVKNETAMLTTFNEADMSEIISIRKKYQDAFMKEHDIKLGFMSFFIKASTIALKLFPMLNSRIEGEEIVTPEYCDIGIAVQAEKGLMVPVVRNAEVMGLAAIEKEIAALAAKARSNRISIEDMSGGTFTITNGGVFGSMMSTPILNPPQSAILGMHNIIDRPVALNGQVVIRPMMYLALSYDHRVIDGKDSVSFLVKVKELLENPQKMMFSGNDPDKALLDL